MKLSLTLAIGLLKCVLEKLIDKSSSKTSVDFNLFLDILLAQLVKLASSKVKSGVNVYQISLQEL